MSGLHVHQPTAVRISAARAALEFCGHLKSTNSVHLLQPHLANIIEGLVSIAQQFSTEVLALSLESLCMVLAVSIDLWMVDMKLYRIIGLSNKSM